VRPRAKSAKKPQKTAFSPLFSQKTAFSKSVKYTARRRINPVRQRIATERAINSLDDSTD
jgi:hypothetical protein